MAFPRRSLLAILSLMTTVWLVYGHLAWADFVWWDDPDMVWQNPGLNPPTFVHLIAFWKAPFIRLYTPMAYTLWSGIAGAAAMRPAAFHLLNVGLQTAAGVFAFLLLSELIPSVAAACAGAMLFVIHPLQVEPVAWVSGMNNLLCGAFGLAALWQYVLCCKTGHKFHLAIATALYAAALLSKPMAVTLPLAALVIDRFILQRPIAQSIKSLTSWFAMAAAMAIVARLVQPPTTDAYPGVAGRLWIAIYCIGFYATKLLFPVHLAIDYQRTPAWLMAHLLAAWPGLVALLFGVFIWMARRQPGLLISLIFLLPVLGLTSFSFQAHSMVADRYMYLAMFGPSLLLAGLLQRFHGPLPWTLAGIVLLVLAIRSFDQTRVWNDTESLAAQQLAVEPGSVTGHKILAAALAAQNRNSQAEIEYRAAIAALDDHARLGDGVIWFDYGNLLRREGRYSQAIEQYQQALPLLDKSALVWAYNNMGLAYYDNGDRASARQQFINALKVAPEDRASRQNLDRLDAG